MLETNPTEDGTGGLGRGRTLKIREISLIPIIVPLDGVYRGSYYRMENRASVITRVSPRRESSARPTPPMRTRRWPTSSA